ncbi:hypothetical protein [Aridibaculum aurantiacum]|uniref:hypothetical protein n=1 Tax=Aridibaculum aurantiacum TaxID=2810307 RepID=UPI001A976C0A|nr:hypothetical protein [Aridibaculum aurantiacum]
MNKWYKVALFNLVVLAFLGFVLRYKINFPLDFIEQKKLLHAHSHFAFGGWISFLLQLLIISSFSKRSAPSSAGWNKFFLVSTGVNYAMIFSFALQGYSPLSIVLSTVSLLLSYYFIYKIYGEVKDNIMDVSSRFIMTALFFLALSSLGPYALAYMIATKNLDPYHYHNALYFFLHFQYNGWFTFAVLGFLFKKVENIKGYKLSFGKGFFYTMVFSIVPAYFLTTLWHKMPQWVVVNNVVAAVFQLIAIGLFVLLIKKSLKNIFRGLPALSRMLYWLSITAFLLKAILQCVSAHPQVGHIAFTYRPIIVGYLHLVFLVFVSFYLLGMLAEAAIIPVNKVMARGGLLLFTLTVLVNEVLLGVQGVGSLMGNYFPSSNTALFINTIFITIAATFIFLSATSKSRLQQF